MDGGDIGALSVVVLLVLIYLGMHISVALLLVSFVCVSLLKSPEVSVRMIGGAAADSISEYLFGVIPLFILMGMLVTISGIGRDTFDIISYGLRRMRSGLGVATVGANAVFAAITGVSLASATVFTKVAVPELVRNGYSSSFSLGLVAGSSVLGMLIPPSLLMIVYGVLAEESVGKMFLAGVVPGLLLAGVFSLTIVVMARLMPHRVFAGQAAATDDQTESTGSILRKAVPIATLIALVLGGLYGGIFTPTEAGAVGAMGALVIALIRRSLTRESFWNILVETGFVAVSVLFLVIGASFYSRMLALSGLPLDLATWLTDLGLGPIAFVSLYVLVVLLMGCIIDSVSIMLILLPIVLPVIRHMGLDPIWFGVVTVIAVEMGLITPPFGLSVFAVKATVNDDRVGIGDIFRGAFPFLIGMLITLLLLFLMPGLATWLPKQL